MGRKRQRFISRSLRPMHNVQSSLVFSVFGILTGCIDNHPLRLNGRRRRNMLVTLQAL
ncbi:hypothetical protein ARMSODRAFT_949842 [Armillaria solidipes]|uniref:Uncharacterized protein n=1 Tax=Armillaria solidipes TaxID=1076256 RepID=A0A2H3BXI5_9AGAR|nr:hypothetical protein ARMSODRAFT_949842 [Armillaria solidipes]